MTTTEQVPSTDASGGRRCECCGASSFESLFEVRGFPIERCKSCGLGRATVPSDFDPTHIYDEAYFQGGHKDGYADYQGSAKTLRREFRETLSVIEELAPHGRLLELGCAYGYFLDEAQASFQVAGVEVASEAVHECQQRGLDVRQGPLTEPMLADIGTFDVAVLLDVIEHLPHPDETLGQVARAVRMGGHLVLTTGDFGSLLSRAMRSRWRLMTPPQHLYFFTPKSLSRLLRKTGFEIVRIDYPWKRVPMNLLTYQLGRFTGLQHWARRVDFGDLHVSVNLFDAMRVIARRT